MWMSKVKTMTGQTLEESKSLKDSCVTETVERLIIDALELYAVEGQYGAVPSVASSALRFIIHDVLEKEVVAGQVH